MALFRATQGFRVPGKTSLSLKDIADQPACAGANQNTGRIRPRQRFQAQGEVYRVADHGRVGFFLRTDVASEDIAMIDANADPERRNPCRFPFRIEI